MDNFLTIVQNGYVPGQFFHIVLNGLLTAGVIIMAISAWHLLRNNATRHSTVVPLNGAWLLLLYSVL